MMDLIYDGSMDSRLFKDILGKTIKELSEQDSDFIYLDADLMSCIGTSTPPRTGVVITHASIRQCRWRTSPLTSFWR